MNTLKQIQEIIGKYPEGKILLDEPLKIKATPHQHVFTVYGLWSGADGVYVLDGAGEWHGPLLENQIHGPLMINSIYQRLKAMEIKPSVVIAEYDQEVNATIFE